MFCFFIGKSVVHYAHRRAAPRDRVAARYKPAAADPKARRPPAAAPGKPAAVHSPSLLALTASVLPWTSAPTISAPQSSGEQQTVCHMNGKLKASSTCTNPPSPQF